MSRPVPSPQVCNAFTIKFPIDHVVAGATELSREAVAYAYGAPPPRCPPDALPLPPLPSPLPPRCPRCPPAAPLLPSRCPSVANACFPPLIAPPGRIFTVRGRLRGSPPPRSVRLRGKGLHPRGPATLRHRHAGLEKHPRGHVPDAERGELEQRRGGGGPGGAPVVFRLHAVQARGPARGGVACRGGRLPLCPLCRRRCHAVQSVHDAVQYPRHLTQARLNPHRPCLLILFIDR